MPIMLATVSSVSDIPSSIPYCAWMTECGLNFIAIILVYSEDDPLFCIHRLTV